MRKLLPVSLVVLSLGCTSVGPRTIQRDRFDYGEAIMRSWREQMLLAILQLRYMEIPNFVEVSSVVNQYALETDVRGNVSWGDPRIYNAAAGAKFSDRPTITYIPIAGTQFTTNLLTPVPPGAVLWLIQSGWKVEWLMRTCLKAINGLNNRGNVGRLEADGEFNELLELLTLVQTADGVGMRVADTRATTVAMTIRRSQDPEAQAATERIRDLMGLSQEADVFNVVYGSESLGGTQIAMLTRSLFELLFELGRQIDVPEEHVAEGRTIPSTIVEEDDVNRLIHVHNGSEPSEFAFVSVRYRDRWFWIDDRDLESKRTFAFVTLIWNLTQVDGGSAVPLLTVGASG